MVPVRGVIIAFTGLFVMGGVGWLTDSPVAALVAVIAFILGIGALENRLSRKRTAHINANPTSTGAGHTPGPRPFEPPNRVRWSWMMISFQAEMVAAADTTIEGLDVWVAGSETDTAVEALAQLEEWLTGWKPDSVYGRAGRALASVPLDADGQLLLRQPPYAWMIFRVPPKVFDDEEGRRIVRAERHSRLRTLVTEHT